MILSFVLTWCNFLHLIFISVLKINSCQFYCCYWVRSYFVPARLSFFSLQFKKHVYSQTHNLPLLWFCFTAVCSLFKKTRDLICSDTERHRVCKSKYSRVVCLVLTIYWLISKDSRWAADQSCMVWRFCFFKKNLFLHYCFSLCLSSGRRAGMLTNMQVSSYM